MRMVFYGAVVAGLLVAGCQTSSAAAGHHLSHGGDGKRAYVMNGLIAGPGLARIADRLRARGIVVRMGWYSQASDFAADACVHRGSHIIIVGHSLGAAAATNMANEVHRCGVRSVTIVSIDPPNIGAVVEGVHAVNFVGAFNGHIAGARNISAPGYGHMDILESPTMQARILSAAQ